MATAAIVSYRLGGADGVSIEAEKWADALISLGWSIRRVAGDGPEGTLVVAGLGISPEEAVDETALEEALDGCDLVIVENLCSLPLNPAAGAAVASALRGRPAILRHHDLPWQRESTSRLPPPPDDPAWRHVTINELSRDELAERGIEAVCLYNRFDLDPPAGDRNTTRETLGLDQDDWLLLQPTRALPRKNVPGGLALAAAIGATYWLTAAAEDGYETELARLLATTSVRVLRGQGPGSIHDAYAASDAVVLPSTWEGFGNPIIESIAHRRPLALSHFPVAKELRAMGMTFFDPEEPAELSTWLHHPDHEVLEANLVIARSRFDIADLPDDIAGLLMDLGLS